MTVAELIEELKECPPSLSVYVWNIQEDQVSVTRVRTMESRLLFPYRDSNVVGQKVVVIE